MCYESNFPFHFSSSSPYTQLYCDSVYLSRPDLSGFHSFSLQQKVIRRDTHIYLVINTTFLIIKDAIFSRYPRPRGCSYCKSNGPACRQTGSYRLNRSIGSSTTGMHALCSWLIRYCRARCQHNNCTSEETGDSNLRVSTSYFELDLKTRH